MSNQIISQTDDRAKPNLDHRRNLGNRHWPARNDADYANPAPSLVRIGDTIGTWTVVSITPDIRVEHASNCGQYPLGCSPYSVHNPPLIGGTVGLSDCRLVPTGEYFWELACLLCEHVKVTRDPFNSRSCRNWHAHSRDISQLARDIQRVVSADIGWKPPVLEDLKYSAVGREAA